MIGFRVRTLCLTGAVLAALSAGAPAVRAQATPDPRVIQLEKQVRELRAIVFQGRDTGQPVVVKPDGPDPAVTALASRVDDLEQTLRRATGQLETLQHDLDDLRRADREGRADRDAQLKALADRIGRVEQTLASGAAPALGAPGASGANPVIPPPADALPPATGARAQARADATARAQAGDTGRLGELPVGAAPAPAASPAADFKRAKDLLAAGDTAAAGAAFDAFVAAYPSHPRAAEARYWSAETLYARGQYADAARGYATALKGWPKSTWAPDALVKLSQSLYQLQRTTQVCAALVEFDRRYAAAALPAVKARAEGVRQRAQCPAG